MQRACNKYFGYSAQQTLDYAQSLYEKKLITYPRTDSRFLTEDMRVAVLEYIYDRDTQEDRDEKNFRALFDSSKVSDHHAIIPTRSSLYFEKDTLLQSERKVYDLIFDTF